MTDERLEVIVANLLRTGVILAAAVVLVGGVWYLAASAEAPRDYHHFRPVVQGVKAIGALPAPEAVILAGLLILIATPVARVVFTLVAFALAHERAYIVITAIVLAVLLYSLVGQGVSG